MQTKRLIASGVAARLAACVAAAVLSGCAGPAVKPGAADVGLQAPALPERYDRAVDSSATELPGPSWWHTFGDPALAEVVIQTLRSNADIRVANARVAQAQAVMAGTQAEGGPRIDVNAGITRQRGSNADPSLAGRPGALDRNTTIARAGASLAWEWDVFGRQAQALSASQQRLLSQQAAEAATALTVASEAARLVIEIRALQQQLRLASATVDIDREVADVAALRLKAGLESQLETLRADAMARSSAAAVQQFVAALANAQLALAVLAGVTPDQVQAWLGVEVMPRETATTPGAAGTTLAGATSWPLQEPAVLAVGLPSDLLRRRPDIVQAQASLRAASADLAATAAERWPRFNLAASLGWVAASVASLGTAGSLAASLAPAITWRLWDGGAIQAQIDQRTAQEREALAGLQQSVMRAFAEAATAMKQREQRRAEVEERVLSSAAAAQAEQVTQSLFNAGLTDWTQTLDARRARVAAQSAEILSRQQQALAHVSLYRALGGGWLSTQR